MPPPPPPPSSFWRSALRCLEPRNPNPGVRDVDQGESPSSVYMYSERKGCRLLDWVLIAAIPKTMEVLLFVCLSLFSHATTTSPTALFLRFKYILHSTEKRAKKPNTEEKGPAARQITKNQPSAETRHFSPLQLRAQQTDPPPATAVGRAPCATPSSPRVRF